MHLKELEHNLEMVFFRPFLYIYSIFCSLFMQYLFKNICNQHFQMFLI